MSSEINILAIIISSSVSFISIIFVATTFFLTQYEQNRYESNQVKKPYKKATQLMNLALLPATISLTLAVLVGADIFGSTILKLSVILLGVESVVVIISIVLTSNRVLEEGLLP